MSDKSLPLAADWPVLIIRRQRVTLDVDLARTFGIPADEIEKRFRRNRSRFPEDFIFRLTAAERDGLIAACPRLRRLKFSRTLPLAFTETGVLMLASVLEGPAAETMSVEIIRAFIEVRQLAEGDGELARGLAAIESRYDAKVTEVFDAIRALMEPPPPKPRRPRTGFGHQH